MLLLYQALEVLFVKERCEDVIDRYLKSDASRKCYDLPDEDRFVRQMAFELPIPNYEEPRMVYRQMREKWAKANTERAELQYQDGESVFNAWLNYVADKIHLQNNQPVCRYRYLGEWHKMGVSFGEDMATAAFLASYDLKERKKRETFDWPVCLNHDSCDLQVMMRKKMVDLHAHLYASTENFDLNWICLMNHVKSREGTLRRFDEIRLSPTLEIAYHGNDRRLYIKVLIAAAIRLFLCSQHHNDGIMPYQLLLSILYSKSETELALLTQELQGKINLMANIYGWNSQGIYDRHVFRPDYAIEKGVKVSAVTPLVGERKLLYDTFRNVFRNQSNNREGELFYLYLLIKEALRREMTYQDRMKGFENFGRYNDRKYVMIDSYPQYSILAERMVAAPFFDNNEQKRYLELRVKPEGSRGRNIRYIHNVEKHIKGWDRGDNTTKDWMFDFVFHFIKQEDETIGNKKYQDELLSRSHCRHYQLRKRLKYLSREIGAMNFGPHISKTDDDIYRSLLVGIDAANGELTCRPEVFAQTFRYLKSKTLKNYDGEEYNLGRTYHVGEVFYDVVDGLRAIDEVIKFFEFGIGDRLGHATVLGVDVNSYYERHGFSIKCPKQDLLDNFAWLYVRVQKWTDGKTAFCGYLYEEYAKLFREVYNWKDETPDIYTYYQSWLLRGDNPYEDTQVDNYDSRISIEPWDWCSRSRASDIEEARKNQLSKCLFKMYHFDRYVKEKGHEVTLYKIHAIHWHQWVECVDIIRELLLGKVEKKHISIECNPTSNILIGEVKNYEEHPIVKFFNHGLRTPYPEHNICVSINTDDKGVFSTSLEREYSMMALSLEKGIHGNTNNSPREILDWLNQVRKMSQEQMFNKNAIG